MVDGRILLILPVNGMICEWNLPSSLLRAVGLWLNCRMVCTDLRFVLILQRKSPEDTFEIIIRFYKASLPILLHVFNLKIHSKSFFNSA